MTSDKLEYEIHAGRVPDPIHDPKPVDGPRLDAVFRWPGPLTVDFGDDLWTPGFDGRMRVVPRDGDVQTLSLRIPESRPGERTPVPCTPAGEGAVVVVTEDGRAAATNLEGTATSLWTPPPPLRVRDVALDSDGTLYAVAPNGEGRTSMLLLKPDGSVDELTTLAGNFEHIAARGGTCWLRNDYLIMRLDRGRTPTQVAVNDVDGYTISPETVGFEVDENFNLYVGCIYSGVFRIDPEGRAGLVIPMDDGANGLSIAPNGHLYVASNLCIFLRTRRPLAGHSQRP